MTDPLPRILVAEPLAEEGVAILRQAGTVDVRTSLSRDELLAAIGGVVGVTGVGRFLGPNGPTVQHLVEHIDHMVSLIGPEHVGIGMDSAPNPAVPGAPWPASRSREYWPASQYADSGSGYVQPEAYPKVTEALIERGYSDDAIKGILGGNFLKLAEKVWR